jgi:hypothetical protein
MKLLEEQKYQNNNNMAENIIYEVEAESLTDLSKYNIMNEINLETLINKILILYSNEPNEIFNNLEELFDIIINIKKVTCRCLTQVNDIMLDHNVHLLMFFILENYRYSTSLNDYEAEIVVK